MRSRSNAAGGFADAAQRLVGGLPAFHLDAGVRLISPQRPAVTLLCYRQTLAFAK
jgi:hypothetical protein